MTPMTRKVARFLRLDVIAEWIAEKLERFAERHPPL